MAKQLQIPISDELMASLKSLARERNTTLTVLVNHALERLLRPRKVKAAA